MITQATPSLSLTAQMLRKAGLVIQCHSQSVSECQSAFIQKMPDCTLIIFFLILSPSLHTHTLAISNPQDWLLKNLTFKMRIDTRQGFVCGLSL